MMYQKEKNFQKKFPKTIVSLCSSAAIPLKLFDRNLHIFNILV